MSWPVGISSCKAARQSFLLPRLGGFSVYREGLDRESLKCATRILAEARFPLVIFPEGFVTRNNDRLMNLMDGVAFLARAAAKQRAASPRLARSCCIRFLSATFSKATSRRPSRRSCRKSKPACPGSRRVICPCANGLSKPATPCSRSRKWNTSARPNPARRGNGSARLLDHLLEPLEREWTGGRREPDPMTRIKRLRAAILPEMVHGELTEEERARRWRQLADLYLAQQLHCYSGDYLADAPTPERLLEMVERYEEDLTDAARPHPPHPCRHLRRPSHRSNANPGSQRRQRPHFQRTPAATRNDA